MEIACENYWILLKKQRNLEKRKTSQISIWAAHDFFHRKKRQDILENNKKNHKCQTVVSLIDSEHIRKRSVLIMKRRLIKSNSYKKISVDSNLSFVILNQIITYVTCGMWDMVVKPTTWTSLFETIRKYRYIPWSRIYCQIELQVQQLMLLILSVKFCSLIVCVYC